MINSPPTWCSHFVLFYFQKIHLFKDKTFIIVKKKKSYLKFNKVHKQ